MRRRTVLMASAVLPAALPLRAQTEARSSDPLQTLQWPALRDQYIGKAAMEFSQAVIVRAPSFAEDALHVPLQIDARALQQQGIEIDHILVLVDRNPIREVLSFSPLKALPMLSFRIRMEQASPVRALVKTRQGPWHVGGTWVQAAGGGCTVPGASRIDGSWREQLNQVQARMFPNLIDKGRRLRVRIMHPMDTGLVPGIPAFHIDWLELRDSTGTVWWRMVLHEPVSENPLLTVELPAEGPQQFFIHGQDNNGNRIYAEVNA